MKYFKFKKGFIQISRQPSPVTSFMDEAQIETSKMWSCLSCLQSTFSALFKQLLLIINVSLFNLSCEFSQKKKNCFHKKIYSCWKGIYLGALFLRRLIFWKFLYLNVVLGFYLSEKLRLHNHSHRLNPILLYCSDYNVVICFKFPEKACGFSVLVLANFRRHYFQKIFLT